MKHEFLNALEQSDCANTNSGWQPYHLTISDAAENLMCVMPLYLKTHSYGEYIFDWSWADAYKRHGLNYYPKLLSAIPFTPVTANRVFFKDAQHPAQDIYSFVQASLEEEVQRLGLSSVHILYPAEEQSDAMHNASWIQRSNVQFQWKNNNYQSFDDFLSHFSSRKRKNVKKERHKVQEKDVEIRRLTGEEINQTELQHFYHCYQQTYLKRSGHTGYLNLDFFQRLLSTMANNLMLVQATYQGRAIASAFYLYDEVGLYGRYWGALEELDGLHFECCYYQGIEFCIEHNIAIFNPGTQGEHKIQRGFEPTFCYSNHYILHPQFQTAIANFCEEENRHLQDYHAATSTLLPFKSSAC